MDDSLSELEARFPNVSGTVADVRRLRMQTTKATREPFIEPPSLIALDADDKPSLEAVGPQDINAWRLHMSHGSSVRLRALEVGAVAELAAGRMVSAMSVERAHMEVAGLAAFCCEALRNAARSGDFDAVIRLILTSYFGSNMRIQVKNTPELGDYLRPEEVRPWRPGQLIKAMDTFRMADEDQTTRSQLVYGLLSEYAHPTMGATTAAFTESTELPGGGWTIRYHEEGRLTAEEAQMALEILLENMRIGHAAAFLLERAEMIDLGDGFRFGGPGPEDIEVMYTQLLQQDIETA